MKNYAVLNIHVTINERMYTMHPFLLRDKNELILIDCGYPTMLNQIRAEASANGFDLNALTRVILTHQDFDHSGGLSEIKAAYPTIKIMASEKQSLYISGREESPRSVNIRTMSLTPAQMARMRNTRAMFGEPKFTEVDAVIKDYEVLPFCGGIEAIPTPEHITGHISFYLKEIKTLISGDALILRKTGLCLPNNNMAQDEASTAATLEKLMEYDIEKIICYHGGVYEGDVKSALQNILRSLSATGQNPKLF